MKKTLSAVLAVLLLLSLGACAKKQEAAPSGMSVVIDANEYNLYQDIFFNGNAQEYTGEKVTKTGIFTTVHDSYAHTTRYYVWGFFDQTKCCDWQWELKLDDTSALPADGSLIQATGTFEGNDSALDKYWYKDVTIEVKQDYAGPACDIDMTTMSATLERVQLINIQQFASEYAGKTVRVYGRVLSPAVLQHPFYDGAWTLDFTSLSNVPATGTQVVVTGTCQEDGDSTMSVFATKIAVNEDLQ